MARSILWACLIVAAIGFALVVAQVPETQPATTTASADSGAASADLLSKMDDLLNIRPQSREDYERQVRQHMPKVLESLGEMESKYPQCKEIHEARMMGLLAASRLARVQNDSTMATKASTMGQKIIDAKDAPPLMKVFADAHLTMMKINPVGDAASRPAVEPDKMVRQFVDRYAKTDYAMQALKLGMQMAAGTGDRTLFEGLRDQLIEKFPEDPDTRDFLREQGKGPDVGKPFQAKLTCLDGKQIELPKDLLGKVVVVDFWATWCGPCVREIPRMKTLYERYKDKGVEFVGISLDKEGEKTKVAEFVKERQMGWVHTYSGQGWEDPTAHQYGVTSIPAIWVIGKDGRVISDNARASLAEMIEKALSESKPPAGKPDASSQVKAAADKSNTPIAAKAD